MPWQTMRVIVGERRSGKTTIVLDTYRHMLEVAYEIESPYGFLHLADQKMYARHMEPEMVRIKREIASANPRARVYGKEYLYTWDDIYAPGRSLVRQTFDHVIIEEPVYSKLTFEQMLQAILPLEIKCLTFVGGDRPGVTQMKQALMLMSAS